MLRVGGADLKVGRLPGEGLHRRRLIKYAAPVASIQVLPDPRSDGPADVQPSGPAHGGVAEAAVDGGTVRLEFDPPLPDLTALPPERLLVSVGRRGASDGRAVVRRTRR